MAIEHLIWRFFSKRRFGTFFACLLIPESIVFTEVSMKPFTTTQRFVWVGIGAAIGLLAFAFLSTQDWLRQTIATRRARQENVKSLVRARWILYLFVLPFLLFSILLVVVIFFF
jgi:H+/Cl- antiporter ClcA